MKKILIIGSITVAAALMILLFASVYQPKVNVAEIITPTPFETTPEPSPTPTPEIKILEDKNNESFLFLGFQSLLETMTTSQYDYIMQSTFDFFNSLYQSNIRSYPFEQYILQYEEILTTRFNFENNEEISVLFNTLNEIFVDETQSYLFVLDEASLEIGSKYFTYKVDLFMHSEKVASFDFTVNKKTSEINIK